MASLLLLLPALLSLNPRPTLEGPNGSPGSHVRKSLSDSQGHWPGRSVSLNLSKVLYSPHKITLRKIKIHSSAQAPRHQQKRAKERNQVKTRPVWSQEFVASHLAEACCLLVVSVRMCGTGWGDH